MSKELNTHLLATMIKKKRGDQGLRAVAEEIEVSAPTLSRIEQEKVPDVDTFLKICRWLKMSPEDFVRTALPTAGKRTVASNKDLVISQLRADKVLSPRTLEILMNVIEMAYMEKREKKQ